MGIKEFKNLEEQIMIMEYKGMEIPDKEYAKEILLRENYFFLNGYRHLFLKSTTEKHFLQVLLLMKCIAYFYLIEHSVILFLKLISN